MPARTVRRETAARPEKSGRAHWNPWELALFATAFLIRCAVMVQLQSFPLSRNPQMDSREYLEWATRISAGDLALPIFMPHAPGYPFFLGALLHVFWGSLTAVHIVQALMGAVVCVLVCRLASRYFSLPAARIAGFLLAVDGPLIFLEDSLLAEGLFVFLVVLLLLLLSRPRLSIWESSAAGILLALSILVRSTGLLLVPLVVLALLLSPDSPRRRIAACAVFFVSALAVLSPLVIASARNGTGMSPLQGYGGMNFYLGNSPSGNGLASARSTGAWDRLEGDASRHGLRNPAEQDRFYYRKTFSEIRRHPAAYLRLLGRKFVWSLQAEEVRDTHSLYFFETGDSLLRFLPGFGILFPLAAVGLVFARGPKTPLLVAGYCIFIVASEVLLVVGFRYRIPVVPGLAVFAGAGLFFLWTAFREGQYRRLAVAALPLAAAFVATHLWRHEPSHEFAEEWTMTGTALQRSGDAAGAERAYAKALASNPLWADAWAGRGSLRLAAGNPDDAARDLSRAVALDPDSQLNHRVLSRALAENGLRDAAIRELEIGASIEPDDIPNLEDLGQAQLAAGNIPATLKTYWHLLGLVPEHAAANLALAHLEQLRHHPWRGLRHAETAVEADPGNAQSWIVLAQLAIDLDNRTLAEESLRRAENLGGDSRWIAISRACLLHAAGNGDQVDRVLRGVVMSDPSFSPAIQLLLRNAVERRRLAEAKKFLEDVRKSPA